MNEPAQQMIDATLGAVGHKAAVGGGITAFLGWAFSSQAVGLWGVLIALVGLLMQLYFNRRRDKREQAEYEYRMRGGK